MDLFKNLLDRAALRLGYGKSFMAPSPQELSFAPARLPDPTLKSYTPYVRAYADRAWVYACVSVIADAVASSSFALRDPKGAAVEKHPVLNLLWRPNPFMSGRALRQWIAASLELTGNAYILKDALVGGRPGELWPLLSHLVEVLPGKTADQPVAGYRYRVGAQSTVYDPQDIIHFKYFNPFDWFYGLAPLAAARFAADTLDAAETFNRAFFENSATVSGILSTDQRLDDAARRRIMSAWNERHRAPHKAHKVALLEGGLKWQALAASQKDMDFIAGMKLNRETVLGIFHVPPALVGIFEYSPQYNTKEQQRIFYQTCVVPKCQLIYETLTEFLLPAFDRTGQLYLSADFSDVGALRDDEASRAAAAETYLRAGFSRDEVIAGLGLPFSKGAALNAQNPQGGGK
ncbi:MAG: phage portal protein [Elusimicrobiales bacterium]|nr:phage portal protein [Elusimicrobiales bacterium]